jgi:hypothetical protein
MKKNKPAWLLIAAIIQYLTAAVHTVGQFLSAAPANDTEAQLDKLMSTYKLELGNGFHPTMDNLFLAMSVSFTLLCVFGGVLDNYLWKRNPETSVLKGIVLIQTIIFGLLFIFMLILTFLIPITFTGLIFLSLLIALLRITKNRAE